MIRNILVIFNMLTKKFRLLMTPTNTNISKVFGYYLVIFLGFIYFVLYIYIYFIRERLPKDIPIYLSEIYFFILLWICSIYIYIIIRTLVPKQPHRLIMVLLEKISRPYVYFDAYVKHNKYIYPYYNKLIIYITKRIMRWNSFERALMIYLLILLPRTLLVLIFIIDVFWLHHIEVFYYFIWLGILPLLQVYFKYSLNFAMEGYIQYLESSYAQVNLWEKGNQYPGDQQPDEDEDDGSVVIWYGDLPFLPKEDSYNQYSYESDSHKTSHPEHQHSPLAIYHDTSVSLREYFRIQFEVEYNYDEKNKQTHYSYEASPDNKPHQYAEYCKLMHTTEKKLTQKDLDILSAEFYKIVPYANILYKYLEYDKRDYNYFYDKSTYHYYNILLIRVLIYVTYLICWSYILFLSYSTLPMPFSNTLLTLLYSFHGLEEPFSGEQLINLSIC